MIGYLCKCGCRFSEHRVARYVDDTPTHSCVNGGECYCNGWEASLKVVPVEPFETAPGGPATFETLELAWYRHRAEEARENGEARVQRMQDDTAFGA